MSGKLDVWAAVEEFRQKHEQDLCKIPVDVLTVIEVRLRLDVSGPDKHAVPHLVG
jgi:hypothetical protein